MCISRYCFRGDGAETESAIGSRAGRIGGRGLVVLCMYVRAIRGARKGLVGGCLSGSSLHKIL